ncbi:CRISPR-associated protein Csx16 [Catenovulum sp. SX2]|uniref:CRISPR-associated protein Csx16 n=1 Tax=Catenovulum sp. SX2 TaxID=3398614 RepID=UPI003F8617E6
MKKIAIVPYAGARKWLYKNVENIEAFYEQLDLSLVDAGDQVYGILTIEEAAQVVEKGAQYFSLSCQPNSLLNGTYEQFLTAQPKITSFDIRPQQKGVLTSIYQAFVKKLAAGLNRQLDKLRHYRIADLRLAFYALMTATGIGIFADAVTGVELFKNHLVYWFGKDKAWFEQYFTIYWLIEMFAGLIIFFTASIGLRHQAANWVPLRDVKRQDPDRAYAAIVLTLSTGYRFEQRDNKWFFIKQKQIDQNTSTKATEVELTGDLDQDLINLEPLKIQWELILRILRSQANHINSKLSHAVLLGTQDCSIKNREGLVERVAPGTYPQIKNALKVLQLYPEFSQIKFEPYPIPIPPNDIEAYYNAYLKTARKWQHQYKLAEEDMLIDITGGKSVNSVGAALATLHNKMQFHYVDTNNLNDVLVYRMEFKQQKSFHE